MTGRVRRHFAHKNERGTTVLVVVLVTTLITAIGIFAVRNVTQIDQAVGYSRQSAQTVALAELGTTAAMAEVADTGTRYSTEMSRRATDDALSPAFRCGANVGFLEGATCYPLAQGRIEANTTSHGGETLLEPTVASGDTGSFGPLAGTTGSVVIELTEKRPTNIPIPGTKAGDSAFDVTVTTTGIVSPITSTSDPCGDNISGMTVKKVMRAHVIIPPEPGT
jgi:hypothetical protein